MKASPEASLGGHESGFDAETLPDGGKRSRKGLFGVELAATPEKDGLGIEGLGVRSNPPVMPDGRKGPACLNGDGEERDFSAALLGVAPCVLRLLVADRDRGVLLFGLPAFALAECFTDTVLCLLVVEGTNGKGPTENFSGSGMGLPLFETGAPSLERLASEDVGVLLLPDLSLSCLERLDDTGCPRKVIVKGSLFVLPLDGATPNRLDPLQNVLLDAFSLVGNPNLSTAGTLAVLLLEELSAAKPNPRDEVSLDALLA